MERKIIEFINVSKTYGSRNKKIKALSGIKFSVKEGDFLSLVGKSGAGKSTLIKLLIGEEKPDEGKILFKEKNIGDMTEQEIQRLRRKIGVVYQDYKLLQSKNVWENVEYVMQVIGVRDNEIERDIPQILEIVGLNERKESFPDELSGGEKQRLAIARALCHRPEVIIADEPTGNLDLYNTFEIIDIFKKINKLGAAIILATHDKEIVDSLEQRVITLDKGIIIKDQLNGKFIL